MKGQNKCQPNCKCRRHLVHIKEKCPPNCKCGRHSMESRMKISRALTGRKIPKESIARRPSRKGIKRSPEVCAKISAGLKGKPSHTQTPEARAKISATLKRFNSTYPLERLLWRRRKNNSSESNRKRSLTLLGHPAWKGSGCGKGQWFIDRKGRRIWLRSSWEVKVARYLDILKAEWEYEPKRFDLGNKTYCPDFWMPKWDCFWEVKGYLGLDSQFKISEYRKRYHIPLVVVCDEMYQMICSKVEAKVR